MSLVEFKHVYKSFDKKEFWMSQNFGVPILCLRPKETLLALLYHKK